MRTVEGVVLADYSQVELHAGIGGVVDLPADTGLASALDDEYAILTVARQYGDVPVRIEVHDGPPPDDPAWDAAVELSLRSGDEVRVTGWAGAGLLAAPVPRGVTLRARYAVRDGQAGSEQFRAGDGWQAAAAERYVLQLWPAPAAPARLVTASSPWSQYWAFGPAAAAAVPRLADVPHPDRLVALLDAALVAHPATAARVRAGDRRYHSGLIRYAQELFRVTHATGEYEDLQRDHERLARLIDARAALVT